MFQIVGQIQINNCSVLNIIFLLILDFASVIERDAVVTDHASFTLADGLLMCLVSYFLPYLPLCYPKDKKTQHLDSTNPADPARSSSHSLWSFPVHPSKDKAILFKSTYIKILDAFAPRKSRQVKCKCQLNDIICDLKRCCESHHSKRPDIYITLLWVCHVAYTLKDTRTTTTSLSWWSSQVLKCKALINAAASTSGCTGTRAVIMSVTPYLRLRSNASSANDQPLVLGSSACSISI